jgi:membrane protein DedA with SNARE-associated domain
MRDLIAVAFIVLAAGALDVKASLFFVTLTVCRLVRFGLEAALAQAYGRQILAFEESAGFRGFILVLAALAIGLTTWSAVRLIRSTRARHAGGRFVRS